MNGNTVPAENGIEPEVVKEELAVRNPSVPTTINELAALEEQGEDIVGTRGRIWHSLRVAAIRETNPEDYVLYRAVDAQSGEERITAYLQDSGCSRIRPLLGIDINVPLGQSEFHFERTAIKVTVKDKEGNDVEKEEFAYSVTGDGECRVTGRKVYGVVGTRYSTDSDAAAISEPLRKELRVKGNARINLDGNITRQLAGMKVIPTHELDKAWEGTGKSSKKCTWGRGFADKKGADIKGPGGIQAPICEACGANLQFHNAGSYQGRPYDAFWKCTQYQWDNAAKKTNGHTKLKAVEWEATLAKIAKDKAAERDPGQEG
jgi:hypothetical protein